MTSSSLIPVVAGILIRPGEILFAQRAAHQTHSGEWEFPGGKVEPHEDKPQALARELHEEINVTITSPLFLFDYAEKNHGVFLNFYLVTKWQGEPLAREGQHLGWYAKPWFNQLELLPTNQKLLSRIIKAVEQTTDLLDLPNK